MCEMILIRLPREDPLGRYHVPAFLLLLRDSKFPRPLEPRDLLVHRIQPGVTVLRLHRLLVRGGFRTLTRTAGWQGRGGC